MTRTAMAVWGATAVVIFFIFLAYSMQKVYTPSVDSNSARAFQRDGLKTDTSQSSIDLGKVLSGGPGKDGIPALTNPKFVPIAQATFLADDVQGILLVRGQTVKFYPYTILVWHEVVNDVIAGEAVTVTFCPLCASAIVFDAKVNGRTEVFGVSGKLYESNLLMYDRDTESLWSQIRGEAVVGEKTGAKLTHLPFQQISFADVRARFPNAQILSTDTGFNRDYTFYPYGDYNDNEDIYFPITVEDTRLPLKEPMYIVNILDASVAFKLLDLRGDGVAHVRVGTEEIIAKTMNGEIDVRRADGTVIPGYYALWFSWAIHHQGDGIVWTKDRVYK